jgi:uncharacterized membrane protein YfcA
MSASEIIFVVAVILLASTAQTVAGFGFALIAVPLLVLVLDVQTAVAATTIPALLNAALVLQRARDHLPTRTVATMLAAAFVGMPIGLMALLFAPEESLRLAVAVTSLVLAIAMASGMSFGLSGVAGEAVSGGAAGILGTSTGMNGPPVVLYLQDQRLPAIEFRAALSAFFAVSGMVSILLFSLTGVMDRQALVFSLLGVPSILAGSWAGHRLVSLLSAEAFRQLVLGLLATGAAITMAISLSRLLG